MDEEQEQGEAREAGCWPGERDTCPYLARRKGEAGPEGLGL